MAQPPILPLPLSHSENEKSPLDASVEVSIANLPRPDEGGVGGDVERVIELKPEKLQVVGLGRGKSTTPAVFWIAVNTLATIGIVCFPISCSVTQNTNALGLQVFTNKAIFSDATLQHAQLTFAAFPLYHNMVGHVHHVPATDWHVHVQESGYRTAHPIGHHHVSECHPYKPLSCVLDRHLLPSCSNPPYTHSSIYELRSL